MKKTFRILALALLSVAFCVACEKEETMSSPQSISATEQAEMDVLLREAYATAHSDTPMTITVSSKEAAAYRDRCIELFGSSVLIATRHNESDNNATDIMLITSSSAFAKKIWQYAGETKAISFSTSDKTKWNNWMDEMKCEGYIVIESYDEKTGTYHGVAYTKEEWDKLQ